jgi:catalase
MMQAVQGIWHFFTVTHDITNTKPKSSQKLKRNEDGDAILHCGEKGSADTERDPRGFAMKFYTEDGIGIWWKQYSRILQGCKEVCDFIHTQKRDPIPI